MSVWCTPQIQQISWHKNDFLMEVCGLSIAFVWALSILVRTVWGDAYYAHSPYILSICAAYVALAGRLMAR